MAFVSRWRVALATAAVWLCASDAWSQPAPILPQSAPGPAAPSTSGATPEATTLKIYNGRQVISAGTVRMVLRCDPPSVARDRLSLTIHGACARAASIALNGPAHFEFTPAVTLSPGGVPTVTTDTATFHLASAAPQRAPAAQIVAEGSITPVPGADDYRVTLGGAARDALVAARNLGVWLELQFASGETFVPVNYELISPPAAAPPPAHSSPPLSCARGRGWCLNFQREDPNAYYVCVDQANGYDQFSLSPAELASRGSIMLPNRRLVVAVRYRVGTAAPTALIDATQIGVEEPGIRSGSAPSPGAGNGSQAASPEAECESTRIYTVPSLRSGTTTLTVTLAQGPPAVTRTIPLVVEQVFAGAIRFGLSTIFGPAVSHQYNVLTAAGSSQREVGLAFSGSAEFELVVGASAFLWDLLVTPSHGRSYITPRPWHSYLVPSPFVGIGLVGTLGQKVTAFQSLHLGGEWEFTRAFSVAVTAVLRRTTRLNTGLVVGSPVTDENVESSTHTELNWGVGVVINFSPELLQVATPTTTGH